MNVLRRKCLPLLIVLATGCNWPGKPDPKNRPVPPDKELKFTALYGRNCAGCHGKEGRLGPAPPLNDALFRASISEKELFEVLNRGRLVSAEQRSLMPAFAKKQGGTLSEAQIKVLVYEIKGIPYKLVAKSDEDEPEHEVVKDEDGKEPTWGMPGRRPKDAPAYTVKPVEGERTSLVYQKIRKGVFARACAMCHGEDGKGTGKIGALNDPDFLALVSNQALRRIAITGRSDLGMPGYSAQQGRDKGFKPLTSREIDDLVELLAHWRKGGK